VRRPSYSLVFNYNNYPAEHNDQCSPCPGQLPQGAQKEADDEDDKNVQRKANNPKRCLLNACHYVLVYLVFFGP
jgi:hypothetical protein